jgi:GntR family carbon starvation induced transcriptional regulator
MEVDGHKKIEIPPSLMDSQGPSRGSEYELAAVDAMIESSEPGERGSAASLVEVAYVRLRSDVIHGALAPGEKLRIEELRAKYGLGATPLREALSRLSAVGLVEASAQRGFRVSRVSVEDLDDVTENRVRLECDLLRDSIAHGDEAWEARVAGAFHTLSKMEAKGLPLDADTFSRWEKRNRDFHEALVASAVSRWTARFRAMIYDHHERYRRISHLVGNRSFDVRREHSSLCKAALARDADTACTVAALHIRRTGDAIRRQLAHRLR